MPPPAFAPPAATATGAMQARRALDHLQRLLGSWAGVSTSATSFQEQHPVPEGIPMLLAQPRCRTSPASPPAHPTHGEAMPADPFHPCVFTAGITSCGVKTALPQPERHKSQTKFRSPAAKNQNPSNWQPCSGAAGLRGGIDKIPGRPCKTGSPRAKHSQLMSALSHANQLSCV